MSAGDVEFALIVLMSHHEENPGVLRAEFEWRLLASKKRCRVSTIKFDCRVKAILVIIDEIEAKNKPPPP